MSLSFHNGKVTLHAGNCMEVMRELPANSIDAVCTDPPYHLTSIVKRFGSENAAPINNRDEKEGRNGPYHRTSRGFMGKVWDGGDIAFTPELWAEVLRVLKPGGHMVAFSGTRTYHRMACAIEDAGFEIRDQLAWTYGSGFPKSHDISKAIDKAAGHWRGKAGAITIEEQPAKGKEYERSDKGEPITAAAAAAAGLGTALKPAWEPICLARKPLSESTVAANVLKWGTGAINVDGCRVEGPPSGLKPYTRNIEQRESQAANHKNVTFTDHSLGRFPANLIHDGSPEVLAGFPDSKSVASGYNWEESGNNNPVNFHKNIKSGVHFGDEGSAARFFYTAKADWDDRLGSKHPTVKPVDLMQWLVRLICPKGGVCLDPFAGTGTTGAAAFIEGCRAVLIEREAEYLADIERRMELLLSGPDERARKLAKPEPYESLPLFGVA